jgi:F-type H+-transporting ATPase subunit epsilon
MTVMAHHAPTMAAIRPGIVRVHSASGKKQDYFVIGGFADVLPTGCTVLAESAVPVEDLGQDELARRMNIANVN